MINFEKLEGPFGIPVYYQRMPSIIRSVSMAWVVFTGAADDESVGAPGLYHWLEHVPFRGTKKYSDIDNIFTRYGGKLNARTNSMGTFYHINVPMAVWKEALSVLTDLFAQPLLRAEDIEAERNIIYEEIKGKKSDSNGYAHYYLPELLLKNHPYAHHTLGTEDTLKSMDISTVRRAYELGYDRSRCAFFMVGNIPKEEILSELEKLSCLLPNNNLSERRTPVYCGEISWNKDKKVIVKETEFNSSVVMMLFPTTGGNKKTFFRNSTIKHLLGFGGLASPFAKIIREKYQLAYSRSVKYLHLPEGGYINLIVETSKEKVEKTLEAFKEVLKDPYLYSQERFEEVRDGLIYQFQMMPLDTQNLQEIGIGNLFSLGEVINEKEIIEETSKITFSEAKKWVEEFVLQDPYVLIFKGMGK